MTNTLNLFESKDLMSPRSRFGAFFDQMNLAVISSERLSTGLTIRYGLHETPFGQTLIAITAGKICHLSFLDSVNPSIIPPILNRSCNKANIIHDPQATELLAKQIFVPNFSPTPTPLILLVNGTDLQIQVWQALLKIPLGATTTYSAIAEMIGRPTAVRAIGNAVGKNPIAYLIPCHRVIRKSGELGGYHWGLDRKRLMLNFEQNP